MKLNKETISIGIIILFHLVGLFGFHYPALRETFIQLVPFHILLMFLIICVNHENFNKFFISFVILIVLLGYGIEWKGVNKHTVFGNYSYGNTLGFKLEDVPIIIGVNWLIITYAVGVAMRYLIPPYAIARIGVGAMVMVLLDAVIERIAGKFDYWHWQVIINSKLNAPTSNYIDWFIVSLIMLTIFELFQFKKQNKVGVALLASQFVFFLFLRWS